MSLDEIRQAIRSLGHWQGSLSAHDIAGILASVASYAPAELEKAVDHIDDAITECENEIEHQNRLRNLEREENHEKFRKEQES